MYRELNSKREEELKQKKQELRKFEKTLEELRKKFPYSIYRRFFSYSKKEIELMNKEEELSLDIENLNKNIKTYYIRELLENSTDTVFSIGPEDVQLYNEDGIWTNKYTSIEELSDLMLVHKTNFLPYNNTIYTGKSTGATDSATIKIGEESYPIEWKAGQNSIHFAVNGPVSSHDAGNWDSCKYAVLVPYDKVDTDNLIGTKFEDTYFEGDVKLPESAIIVCPQDDVKIAKQKNPSVKIYGYSGIKLDEAIKCILLYNNIKVKSISTGNGWANDIEHDSEKAKKILTNNGISLKETSHSVSENMLKRKGDTTISLMNSLLTTIKNKNIKLNDDEIKELADTSLLFFKSYKGYYGNIYKFCDYYIKNILFLLEQNNVIVTSENWINELFSVIKELIDVYINNKEYSLYDYNQGLNGNGGTALLFEVNAILIKKFTEYFNKNNEALEDIEKVSRSY